MPKLEALVSFTRAMVVQRGWVEEAASKNFLEAGFTEQHMLGVILAIGIRRSVIIPII